MYFQIDQNGNDYEIRWNLRFDAYVFQGLGNRINDCNRDLKEDMGCNEGNRTAEDPIVISYEVQNGEDATVRGQLTSDM